MSVCQMNKTALQMCARRCERKALCFVLVQGFGYKCHRLVQLLKLFPNVTQFVRYKCHEFQFCLCHDWCVFERPPPKERP